MANANNSFTAWAKLRGHKKFVRVWTTNAGKKKTQNSNYTHISFSGMLSVTLPLEFSPYLTYPKKPMPTYMIVMTVMPTLSTPVVPPKDAGVFMLFSRASTYDTTFDIRFFKVSDNHYGNNIEMLIYRSRYSTWNQRNWNI